jgi:uncharacterized protein YecE (DUF72 family)
MTILVGTASWTDPTLLACGRFYPPDIKTAEARLRHYAARFPLVEVDSSYYALPSAGNAHAWATRTPGAFVFNIKAFRLFTGHRTPVRALDEDLRRELPERAAGTPDGYVYADGIPAEIHDETWRRYLIALEPLRLAGKLGAVHFQFPPWIRPDARGLARLHDCMARLDGHLPSVEFRHRSWFEGAAAASTLARLRELGAVHTVVDAPAGFDDSVPAVWEATHPDVALVRLHGRNAAAWNHAGKASSGRFHYVYTPQELADLARRVRELAQRVRDTHAVLNTNFEDQGVRNAQGLMAALG